MSFAKTPFDNWIRKANEQVDEREKDPNPSAGQTFLAKVVSKTYDASGNVYKFFYESPESGGKKYPAYIFKIRLEEPTGESRTGRENFYFDDSDLREIAQSSEMSFEQARNYMLNNQPDGLYVDNGTSEMPGVGDPVEARSDAGIPNRYRIYAINGQQKTTNGGYANFLPKDAAAIDAALSAFAPLANGTPVSELMDKRQDWSGDPKKWTQEKKLASLDPELSVKVAKLMIRLRDLGFQPTIFYGWRSTKVQEALKHKGNSHVSFSFHNATKDGEPNALSADIVDRRWWWENGTMAEISSYREAIGREAKSLGLIWGGDWASLDDWAHVQLLPNDQLARVRRESDTNLSFA